MKKIIDIFLGLIFILWDVISNLFKLFIDSIITFLGKSKKDNAFLRLIAKECFLVDFTVFTLVFLAVAQFSYFGALIFTFIFLFWFYDVKDRWWREHNSSFSDGSFTTAALLFFLSATIMGLVIYVNTPYKYVEIGEITLTNKDIKKAGKNVNTRHPSIDFKYDNWEHSVRIGKCKEGAHKIYKESVEANLVNFLYTDYMLKCSGEMSNIKEANTQK